MTGHQLEAPRSIAIADAAIKFMIKGKKCGPALITQPEDFRNVKGTRHEPWSSAACAPGASASAGAWVDLYPVRGNIGRIVRSGGMRTSGSFIAELL
jgi:hypothetical protein